MTSETAHLTVDAGHPAIRINIIDGRFATAARGYGRLNRVGLEPGLYKVRYQAADAELEQFVVLEPGDEKTLNTLPELKFASPAPLNLTSTEHERHQRPAHRLSRAKPVALGTGAHLLVFVRDVDHGLGGNPAEGLSLHHLDGSLVRLLVEVMEASISDTWAGCHLELDPGSYRLRLVFSPSDAVETIIHCCPGWQSQFFLLRQGGQLTVGGRPIVDLPGAAQLIVRPGHGFDPGTKVQRRIEPSLDAAKDLRLIELAREALAQGWRGLHAADLKAMLDGKWDDPLLGIYGLHLLLLAPESDLERAERVVGRMRGILNGFRHPDVEALDLEIAHRRGRGVELPPVGAPPMLRRSWQMLLAASARQPSLVPADSLSARIADRLWGIGAQLVWRVPDESRLLQNDGSTVELASAAALGDELRLERLVAPLGLHAPTLVPLLVEAARAAGTGDIAGVIQRVQQAQRELAATDYDRLRAVLENFLPELEKLLKAFRSDELLERADLNGAEIALLTYLERLLTSRRGRYDARPTADPLALATLVERLGLPAATVKGVAAWLVLKLLRLS